MLVAKIQVGCSFVEYPYYLILSIPLFHILE